jgi:peptide deformylase
VAPYDIRVFGDPVLRHPADDVREFDADLARMAEDMFVTMYEAPGVGLAAPQIGVQKRLFVYDIGDGQAGAVVNPRVTERSGEWTYEEGCLSVPGLSWPIVRAAEVQLAARDLEGQEISMYATDLLARVFQHEVDHLDGILLLERLDKRQRKQAMRTLRNRTLRLSAESGQPAPGGAGRA